MLHVPQSLHIKVSIEYWGCGAQILAAMSYLFCNNDNYISFELKCAQSDYKNYFPWYFEGNNKTINNRTIYLNPRGLFFEEEISKTIVQSHVGSIMNINHHFIKKQTIDKRQQTKKHIRFKRGIIQKTKIHNTLVIHYRGTDKPRELTNTLKRNFTVDFGELFEKARKLKHDLNLQNIMFISDDEYAADLAKSTGFIVLDRQRGTSTTDGIHHSYLDRKNLDDAIDDLAYIGMADYLLLGRSCFSNAALILANNLKLGYEYYI